MDFVAASRRDTKRTACIFVAGRLEWQVLFCERSSSDAHDAAGKRLLAAGEVTNRLFQEQ